MISNILDGSIYIGLTSCLKSRAYDHFSTSERKLVLSRSKSHLYSAMEKYGNENFIMLSLIVELTFDEANYFEKIIIWLLRRYEIKNYNIADGGAIGGKIKSENTATHRLCPGCNIVKLHNCFYKSSSTRLKISCYCKDCDKIKRKIKKYKHIGRLFNTENLKYCALCKNVKIINEDNFHIKNNKFLSSYCKECH